MTAPSLDLDSIRRPFSAFVAVLGLVLAISACAGGGPAAGPSGAAPSPSSGERMAADASDTAADADAADAADVGSPDVDDEWVEWDEDASTLDGVYTLEQAERGAEVFANVCSNCHETPEWQEERFLERWHGESVFRFFFYVWERMPNGEPPYSLPRQDITDVLTYILQLNGLPAGDRELASDDDSLSSFWLYWWADEAEGTAGQP